MALDLIETFLAAKFSNAARHLRRLDKVAALEARKDGLEGSAATSKRR